MKIHPIYILLPVGEQIVQHDPLCGRKTHLLQMLFSALFQGKMQLLEGPHQILSQIQPLLPGVCFGANRSGPDDSLPPIIRFFG